MAPVAVTDDYYLILEVQQTATAEAITKSYRRLALVVHPDRNSKSDATAAFQLLGKAYETLKDETTRREYDLVYSQIKATRPPTSKTEQNATKPQPEPNMAKPKSKAEDIADAAELTAIRTAREERVSNWRTTQKSFEDAIFELSREIRKLQKAIEDLEFIRRAEQAEEAAAKSWSTWILSPLYKKPVESEEDKTRKANERLQRLHSKSMKEKMLKLKNAQMQGWETGLNQGRTVFEIAIAKDDRNIRVIEARINTRRQYEFQEKIREEQRAREKAQREENERQEEKIAEFWAKYNAEQVARQEREELARKVREEAARKQREEAVKVAAARQAETMKAFAQQAKNAKTQASGQHAKPKQAKPSTSGSKGNCAHDGWWPKVEAAEAWERLACEKCAATYSYLLQCPDCKMQACASCQKNLRPPKRNRNRNQTNPQTKPKQNQRHRPRPRSPSPEFQYTYDSDYY